MPDPSLYNIPGQPQAPSEEPPPEPIQKIIGDALGGLGNALEQPRRITQGAAARVLSGIITGPTAAIQPPERIAQVEQLWASGARPEDIFHQLLATSWNGGEVPVTSGLSDIVYDPLVYWGAGVPGRVAKAAGIAGSGTNLARAFEWLNAADQATAALPWKATKGTVVGVGKTLGAIPLPSAVKITSEGGAQVAARNIGNFLGSPSAQTQYKMKVRDLIDAVGSVLERGHSFEQDLVEHSLLKQGMAGGTPKQITKALPMIAQAQHELLDQVRQVQDPTARVQAMAVFERVQNTVDDLMKQASANQVSGQAPANAQPLFDQARRSIVAARVLVDRINQNPGNLIHALDNTSPEAAQVYNAFETAMNRIYPAFREMGDLRSVPGRPGGNVLGPPAPGAPLLTNWQITEQTSQKVQQAIDAFWNDTQHIPGVRPGQPVQVMTKNGPVLQLAAKPGPLTEFARNAILAPHADLMEMAGAAQQGVPPLTAILPDRLKDTGINTFPEITHQFDQLMRDRANVGKVLNEVWQKAKPGQPLPVQLPARWNSIENPDLLGQVVNPILRGLGEAPINHVVELFQRPTIQKWLSPRSVNGLRTSIKRWPEGDMLTENPYRLTIDRIARQYQEQYGVRQSGLGGALRDITALWKESQLGGNPGYLVTNLMGILANSALEGISPVKVANDFLTNLGTTALHNKRVLIPDLANVQAATGIAMPHSVTSGAAILADANATKEFLGRGITASARIGPVKLGAAGAALGATSGALKPEPNQPPDVRARDILGGAAVGAVTGLAFPAMSEVLLRRIAAGMEAGARENAFLYKFTSALGPRIDELGKLIDAAAYESKLGVKNVQGQGTGLGQLATNANQAVIQQFPSRISTGLNFAPSQPALDAIKTFVESRGGYVHPDWIAENMQKAGVSPQLAGKTAQAWRTMLDGASREGEDFAGRIHVDYEKLNNFEQFMSQMAPFSTWANKMTPFYAEHVLSKPAVLFSLMDYAHMSEAYRQERGLPSRFIGTVEDPQINGVVSAIFGRPIRVAWNPIRGFMPFADVGRLASSAPNEDNPFSEAYKLLTSLGPTPHPLIELGLRSVGAFGTGEPAAPLFSFGNRVLAATGVDLNLPGVRGEQALRTITQGGRTPSDMDTFAIDRKVQELAYRNLGHLPRAGDPASDPYMRARVDQMGPIWDQATKEYRQEQALRAVFSLGGQTLSPQATLTPEEAAIRLGSKPIQTGGEKLTIDPVRYPNVDDQVQRLLVAHKQDEKMPQNLAYPIKELARTAFGDPSTWEDRFGPTGVQLKQYYDSGTVGSLNLLYETVRSAQKLTMPETQGYSGGMSPEETQLSAQLQAYNNPGSLMENLSPEAQAALTKAWFTYQNAGVFRGRLLQDRSASGYWLQQAANARDKFRAGNPMLDQYLAYLDSKPNGNMQDFLDHYWRKGVTGMGTQ